MEEVILAEFLELLKSVKSKCEEFDCAKCPLSVGIYQEGLDYTYYFCDIRKRPREWDLEKKRLKQDKNKKPLKEEKEKRKRRVKKKDTITKKSKDKKNSE